MAKQVSANPVAKGKKGAKTKNAKAAKSTKRRTSAKLDVPRPPNGKCRCGCGEKTGAFFRPGHDARFKGWLIKIANGDGTPQKIMGAKVANKYTWKKKGKGMVPDVDYAGRTYRK